MPTNNVQFKRGTMAAFANVATKDPNTIYFITDTNRIYVGDSEYSRPVLYGNAAPSNTMPQGTLYIREITENNITRQQLYYSNGSTWTAVNIEPGDILAEAITAGNDGNVTPTNSATTFKVPTITVDTKGRVSNAVERTIDLVNFMPKSGGTFTGDVVFNRTLETTSNIRLYRGTQGNIPAIDWDANPGDLYIDAATVSISSPVTMRGASTISATPTINNSIVNKKYVDDKITEVLQATSSAMVFKGTIGTDGTYSHVTSIDFQSAQIGDTYKIISNELLSHDESADHNQHLMKAGDLLVYTGNSAFTYVPSGDEDVTSIKIANSGDTINVSTTAQTGTVVLGDVAAKKVSASTTLNGNGASNDNVPTELAVKTYVDTALSNLTDTKVTTVTNTGDGNAVTGGSISNDGTTLTLTKGTSFMPAAGGTFDGDITVNGNITTESLSPKSSNNSMININTFLDSDNNYSAGFSFIDSEDGGLTSRNSATITSKYVEDFDSSNHEMYKDSQIYISAGNVILYGANDGIDIGGTLNIYSGVVQRGPQGQESNSLTQKSYVDNAIASAISVSDAMVFKGTVGTSGTASSFSAINVSSATKGDTYKVITADTLPAASSFDSTAHDLTPGDLIVYMGESKFIYVPSGDEDVTSVKVAGSGDTINVSTTAQTGTVVLGDVATKKVSTSTTLNGSGASNDNVATELAVKTYVDTALSNLTDTKVTTVTNTGDGNVVTSGSISNDGTTLTLTKGESFVPAGGGTFSGDVAIEGTLNVNNINNLIVEERDAYENYTAIRGTRLSSIIPTNNNNLYTSPTIDITWNQGSGGSTFTKLSLNAAGNSGHIELNAGSEINANAPLYLSRTPEGAREATTKEYVDNAISSAALTWEIL